MRIQNMFHDDINRQINGVIKVDQDANDVIEQEVKERYRKEVSIISGGSDYHADHKKGSKTPRELGECGLTMDEFMENEILYRLINS